MSPTSANRAMATIAGIGAVALVLTACGSSSSTTSSTTSAPAATSAAVSSAPASGGASSGGAATSGSSTGGASGGASGGAAAPATDPNWCETLKSNYPDISGKTVTLYTAIVAPQDKFYIDSYKPFEQCTGVKVSYEGSKEFEGQLPNRVQAGNPPDTAIIPQPGLLQSLVNESGKVVAPDQKTQDEVKKWFPDGPIEDASVDGTLYSVPGGANVKSYVWYSPKAFKDKGYQVPTTFDELVTLSDKMVADNPAVKPWCMGIESGNATGWPLTDWMEDMMLRMHGPEVYDQWVNHEIPFNDPKVVDVLEKVGSITRNPKYMNGGFGAPSSIATTPFGDGGKPITEGKCYMHRQASFYGSFFPEGTKIGEDGDVFAFYFPPVSPEFGKPVLVAGDFVAAFADRPEVHAFQFYLASDIWANEKVKGGEPGTVSSNRGLKIENVKLDLDKLSAEILKDPNAVTRFDASDQMPTAVNQKFWAEMTTWIRDNADSKVTLDGIEASWPS